MYGSAPDRENLVAILQAVQEAEGYLSPERVDEVARYLDVSPNHVYSVAGFYPGLRSALTPDGSDAKTAEEPVVVPLKVSRGWRGGVLRRDRGAGDRTGIDGYAAAGGYGGLAHAVAAGPDEVLDELQASRLRSRTDEGLLVADGWRRCQGAVGDEKYVVCNEAAGSSVASVGSVLLERDPHSVLEGMIIGAYAVGASHGYIIINDRHRRAVESVGVAIREATEKGFLGKAVLGDPSFDFTVEVREISGGSALGEETAAIRFLEGRRATPRPRPPDLAVAGLMGQPTSIDSAETFANVTAVLNRGAERYAEHGTALSSGTKLFILTGSVSTSGIVEVSFGITLKEILWGVGDGAGVVAQQQFKAAQIGGLAGGYWPASALDTPVDHEHLTGLGLTLGSGEIRVLDDRVCMVDQLRRSLASIRSDSCGQCVVGREGTGQMLEIVDRMTEGQGRPEDMDLLLELAEAVKTSSLCAFGKNAADPVLSALRFFREEFDAHIKDRECPTGVCSGLGGR